MKVLVCIPCLLNGGTEVQTLSLVDALVAANHLPVVACYFEYDNDMVERYRRAGADVRIMSPDGLRPKGLKNTIKHLWNGLRQIVKADCPDVAHVQYMTPGALAILILRVLGMKNILATTHTDSNIYDKNGLRIIRYLTNHVLIALQCITLQAERCYFGSASLFDGKLGKHFTIYNALPAHIKIRKEPKRFNFDIIIVGVVSRLAEIKGMDLVIPAFNKAREKDARLRMLIVGDGAQRCLMEHQAEDSIYNADIEFIGMKPQSELQEWYDRIDILLMPSRSEGFGLTAIEGMARGCVPIVANVGGLPEVVTEECGFLHESENTDEMADKIIDAISRIEEKSRASFERAKCFSSERYNIDIRTLYNLL